MLRGVTFCDLEAAKRFVITVNSFGAIHPVALDVVHCLGEFFDDFDANSSHVFR